jgi:hypothetical protein
LRSLVGGLPRDWREAARVVGVQVYSIAALPIGAAFAFDARSGIVWATVEEEGCGWSAWAGIVGILAARNALEIGISDLCAIAAEQQCASGLFLVSNSA